MAAKLRGAAPSPHISDGVIYWYEGDTFILNLKITLESMGEEYQPGEGDTLNVCFFDKSGFPVHEFSALDFNDGCASIVFDSAASADMPAGRYFYDCTVLFSDGRRTTVCSGNCAAVL